MLAISARCDRVAGAAERKERIWPNEDRLHDLARCSVDHADRIRIRVSNEESSAIGAKLHIGRMKANHDLSDLLPFLQIHDGDRAARADAMFVDQRIGAGGFRGLLALLRSPPAPVADVGELLVGRDDRPVWRDADGDFDFQLSAIEVHDRQRIIHREANAGGAIVGAQRHAAGVRIAFCINALQFDRFPPRQLAIVANVRFAQQVGGAGRINLSAAAQGQAVHRTAFLLSERKVLANLQRCRIDHEDAAMILDVNVLPVGRENQVHRPPAKLHRLPGRSDQLSSRNQRPISRLPDRFDGLGRFPPAGGNRRRHYDNNPSSCHGRNCTTARRPRHVLPLVRSSLLATSPRPFTIPEPNDV